jgi:hypothetical protein
MARFVAFELTVLLHMECWFEVKALLFLSLKDAFSRVAASLRSRFLTGQS